MIVIGVDPGSHHCAFTIVATDIMIILKDDTFIETQLPDSYKILHSMTVDTTTSVKASVFDISKAISDTLTELITIYKIDLIVVEIQPFTGGKRRKGKYSTAYITRQSLLNVNVETAVIMFAL